VVVRWAVARAEVQIEHLAPELPEVPTAHPDSHRATFSVLSPNTKAA